MRLRNAGTSFVAGDGESFASMFENRSLYLDLFALGLLALVVFLAISLATYDPADPVAQMIPPLAQIHTPDVVFYPVNETANNACGNWGAMAADFLLTKIGIGSYYLVFSMIVLDVLLLRRQIISLPILRGIGWVVSLVGLTTAMSLLLPNLTPGPIIGSGGYLGAMGAAVVEMQFATIGGVIVCASLVLGGLLLCTDYALFRLGRIMLVLMVAGVMAMQQRRQQLKEIKSQDAEVEDAEEVEEEEKSEEVAIRIRGKHLTDLDDDIELDEELEEDEELDEDDEAADEEEEEEADETEPATREVVVKGKVLKTRADKGSEEESVPAPRIRKRTKTEREQVIDSLNKAADHEPVAEYQLPDMDLLIPGDDICFEEQAKEVRRKAKILEKTFLNFGFKVRVVEIETGPVIAQYEVELEAGLRLSRITGLADDLAIALRVPSVRIVAPIPGKNTVGIEVPNETRQVVRMREVIEESNGKVRNMRIPVFLGKDVSGNAMTVDLSTMPHLLIAGRTGTGKSVCLNAIISSILMTKSPAEVRMLMIDPKMVELSGYARLPHLMHPVVTDMKKAEAILAWAVDKMEERYSLLAKVGVRHISSYNQLGREEIAERMGVETEEDAESVPDQLPFIVIVADEIADLMMTAGKEVEQHIIRLAQKSRAVGIHLILATQKPTVDVITGLIKSNLPARIAFQVASRTDSRVVLDEMGADKLLGNGDMLFLWPGTSTMIRGQGTYLSDDEINSIVDAVSTDDQDFITELVNMKVDDADTENGPADLKKRDELYPSAIDIVVREGRGSVSLLQRSLGIGYGRAARLIDFMAEDGIVGAYAGSQAREVLMTMPDWERMQGHEPESESDTIAMTAKPRRSNKVVPKPDPVEEDEEPVDEPVDWGVADEEEEFEDEEVDANEDEVEDEQEEDEYEEIEHDEGDWQEEEPEEEEWDEEVAEDETYDDEDEEEEYYEAESA